MQININIEGIASITKRLLSRGMLKKFGAAALVGTLVAGGACYAHDQKDHAKHEARAAMIRQQASERNITLIDENHVKTLAAKAIGVDESKITFYSIKLKRGDKHNPTADFKPIYKVKCYNGGIKYTLRLDAVTGNVIHFDC